LSENKIDASIDLSLPSFDKSSYRFRKVRSALIAFLLSFAFLASAGVIAERIDEVLWITSDVAVEVYVSTRKADWVFTYKPSSFRIVPAIAIVV